MPKTNKVPLANGEEAELETVVMGKEGLEKMPCGHINKHFYNSENRLTDLPCDLPDGHNGDHHARHVRLVPDHLVNEKGQVVQARYRTEEADAYWGDAAGIPAKDIHAVELPQLSEFQKDLVANLLRNHPELKAEDAVAEARKSPTWGAANA